MKKWMAMLLAATMVFSLTACGSKEETEETEGTMTYAVEAGSAGEAAAEEKGFTYNSVASQADALMEVAAGTSDAAIIDLLMAGAMIGEGTDYANLAIKDELNAEEYGVAFRKGSDAAEAVNAAFDELKADGTMKALAEKYSLTLAD